MWSVQNICSIVLNLSSNFVQTFKKQNKKKTPSSPGILVGEALATYHQAYRVQTSLYSLKDNKIKVYLMHTFCRCFL